VISFDEALRTVLESAVCLPIEHVALSKCLGRVLGADAVSDMDMPPHDLSAMDGFACRQADLDAELTEIETIPAGYMPTKSIGPGQCSRIMTRGRAGPGRQEIRQVKYPAQGRRHQGRRHGAFGGHSHIAR